MSSAKRNSSSTSVCTLDLACNLLRLKSFPSKRYLIGIPLSPSWKASVSMAENIMLNSVEASTQPCLTPFVTGNGLENSPSFWTLASIPSWNCRTIAMANSVDTDQTLRYAASDLRLHCLLRPLCRIRMRMLYEYACRMSRDCKFQFQLGHITFIEIDHELIFTVSPFLSETPDHTVVYLHRQFSFRPFTGVTVKNVIEHLGNMTTVVISFVLS